MLINMVTIVHSASYIFLSCGCNIQSIVTLICDLELQFCLGKFYLCLGNFDLGNFDLTW